jgi:ComEC/Rec2-related protein
MEESGQKDYRMLPVALGAWGICLLLGTIQRWNSAVLYVLLFSSFAVIVLLWLLSSRMRKCNKIVSHLFVVLVAGWCIAMNMGITAYAGSHDPAYVNDEVADVHAEFTVMTPPVSAVLRGWDCQYRIRLASVKNQLVLSSSHLEAMVFAQGESCEVDESARYTAVGTLAPALFGKDRTWFSLSADESETLREIQKADPLRSVISHMRQAFMDQCDSLGEQGRVLVPGVTMGVLGQEVVSHRPFQENSHDDSAAGEVIETNFKNSGIVHLLAVSGGHFVLIAALLRRGAALLHLPRLPTAAVVAIGYWLLSLLMFPSDSVLRAIMMGLFGVGAFMLGRPAQAMSSLCWTAIFVIIVTPDFAMSFGFALSCAAVMGIVTFNSTLASLMPHGAPNWVKEAAALSISAQILTLPVQLLMTPSLPLWSVIANICVAPFVTFSTLCGLCSLVVSWCAPTLGWIFAHGASLGTDAMNRCASLFSGISGGVITVQLPSVVAASLVLVIEVALGFVVLKWNERHQHKTD